jgi:hypothetical protein
MYGKINIKCAYDWIVSVSGSSGDYDIVLGSGVTIEEYDETAGSFDTTAPAANDMITFGLLTGSPLIDVANCEVIAAADATKWFGLTDPSA